VPSDVLTYKCLLISPGDLGGARSSVRDAVARWNGSIGEALDIKIELLAWETHGVPDASGSAQKVLNKQIVDKADLGIALFWTRLGTPTEAASSGSVEEIDRLLARGARLLIYRCTAPTDPSTIDLKQLGELTQYLDTLGGRALLGTFDSPIQLARDLSFHLTQAIVELAARDRPERGLKGKEPVAVLTAPRPDVRVRVTATIVGDDMRALLSVSVQNHSPNTVHINGVHFRLKDGMSVFFKRDAVFGFLNARRSLEPGKSYQFFVDPKEFTEDPTMLNVDHVYVTDEIDREFRSEPGALANVLKQLNVLAKD
jgi:hypothetical protein